MQIVTGEFTLSSRKRDADRRTIEWEVTYPPDVAGLKFEAVLDADTATLTSYAAARIERRRVAL